MTKGQRLTLKDFIAAADPSWRRKFVTEYSAADCADLVPLVTALIKTEEAGDTDTLAKILPKTCPGVNADLSVTPLESAEQLYNEIMFLKALAALS